MIRFAGSVGAAPTVSGGLRHGDPLGGSCAKTFGMAGALSTAVLGHGLKQARYPSNGLRAAMVVPLFAGILAADGEEREKRPRHPEGSSLRRPLERLTSATPAGVVQLSK